MPGIFDSLTPLDPRDSYPIFDPKYQVGGWRDVPTEEELFKIPIERRRAGMYVLVSQNNRLYRLGSDLQNSSWEPLALNRKEIEFSNVSELFVEHNFGYAPNVLVIDISGAEAIAEIRHPDVFNTQLIFNKPESGKVILR